MYRSIRYTGVGIVIFLMLSSQIISTPMAQSTRSGLFVIPPGQEEVIKSFFKIADEQTAGCKSDDIKVQRVKILGTVICGDSKHTLT